MTTSKIAITIDQSTLNRLDILDLLIEELAEIIGD